MGYEGPKPRGFDSNVDVTGAHAESSQKLDMKDGFALVIQPFGHRRPSMADISDHRLT